nr:hypothetical protein [Rhabdothermincola sediminis]
MRAKKPSTTLGIQARISSEGFSNRRTLGRAYVAGEGLAFQSLFFIGPLLFFTTLLLNLVADRFVRKVRHAY